MVLSLQDEVLASVEVTSNWKSLCPISAAFQPMHLNAVDAELLQKTPHHIGVEENSWKAMHIIRDGRLEESRDKRSFGTEVALWKTDSHLPIRMAAIGLLSLFLH
jgi:hypothetical protein